MSYLPYQSGKLNPNGKSIFNYSESQSYYDSCDLEQGKLKSITDKLNEQGTTVTALKTTLLELGATVMSSGY